MVPAAFQEDRQMQIRPHDFWQTLVPADEIDEGVLGDGQGYAAALPDGQRILLPIRVLPNGNRAVASLIVNQASFAVLDALADAVAELVRPHAPEIVVGVPTLGLPLAEGVARRLGHSRMVSLGTSRKFWYDDGLSEPTTSITTPDHARRIYLDPRMLALLKGRRIALIDDVVSTGASMASVLRLLKKADLAPVVIAAAMLQGEAWRERLAGEMRCQLVGALSTPILDRIGDAQS